MDFSTYAQWSAYLTVAFLVLTIVAFIAKWGFRFRFFGITSFLVVLTIGLLGLGLGLFARTDIPGAARFFRVYDNGTNQLVITVTPPISESELDATLRQAANDLFSLGRTGQKLTIRARTLLHPEPGISKPLYLGQVRRSLSDRDDDNMQVEIFAKNLEQLPQTRDKS